MALANDAEKSALDWLTGQTGANNAAPVLPLRVRLCTSIPTDTTAGTEVVNAGGSTYTAQNVAFGPANASTGQTSNTALVRFDNMPDTTTQGTVKAFEIWDSNSGTPKRWWWATLTAERSYQAGDAAEFPVNQLVLAME